VSDFNGRIGAVVRAFEKYPAGGINTRMIVRETLAEERADGFRAGYDEGMHDAFEAERSDRARAECETETSPTEAGKEA